MSRSYKHKPWLRERNKRDQKRQAAKKVRHTGELPRHMGYKRVYESWNICDFELRETWPEYLDSFKWIYGREPTEEEKKNLRQEWEKYYLRK